jgi:amidase
MTTGDSYGCFCAGAFEPIAGAGVGQLRGLTFAVKDLIDTKGSITGAGNPDWRRTHAPAIAHAPVVQQLLDAGATLIGRTITDELAFSLEGENFFEGTPVNPAAADRLPGGSSSGSAVAVAAGLVDFALGTDTGGSVRVPAAFCGIYGFRPTHGVISTEGVVPFAPSLDTFGWLTRDAATLAAVGDVLLPNAAIEPVREIFVARDAFALADPDVQDALDEAVHMLALPCATLDVFPTGVDDMARAYQVVQATDIIAALGPWLVEVSPRFGPAVAPRFASIHDHTSADVAAAQALRRTLRERLVDFFAANPDAIIIVPSAPSVALPRGLAGADIAAFYRAALATGAVAGLAGLPQVSIPALRASGLPIGLGVIAAQGRDRALLAFASRRGRSTQGQPADRSSRDTLQGKRLG